MSALNFKIVKKYFQKKTKKSFIAILKSPHVNKKAQEQFETHFYSKQLSIYSTKKLKYLFFLKKIKNNIFSDLKLKIKFTPNFSSVKELNFFFKSKNYVLIGLNKNFISQKISLTNKKIFIQFNFSLVNKILKILDISGELSITK
jgi:hypothetical protein